MKMIYCFGSILQDPDLLQDVDPDPGSEKKIVKNSHKNQPKL